MAKTTKKGSSSTGGSLVELILIVAVALGLALAIQAFLVKPYRIPSESMVPTLQIGQRVLVNRIGARFTKPEIGNVVVFHPPAGAEENSSGVGTAPGRPPQYDEAGGRPHRRRTSSNAWSPAPAIACGSSTARSTSTASATSRSRGTCGGGEGCTLPREITRAGRSLLHDGRQPWLV